MIGSNLVTKRMQAYAGNYTKGRSRYGKITEITVHHCAGIMSIDDLGRLWQRVGREGSSHYGVSGTQIGQYVSEDDIAWTNSHWASNCRAVTIETSNSGGAPNWPVADDTLQTLIKLVADIARRNGLHPLVLGKTLTWHSMYSATACPGPYLKGKLQYIADEANRLNDVTFDAVTPGRSCIVAVTGADGGNLTGGDISYYLSQWVRDSGLDPNTAIVVRDGLVTVGPISNGDQILLKKYSYEQGLDWQFAEYIETPEEPATPDKPATNELETLRAELESSKAEAKALRNSLASMTAERDTALQQAQEAGEKTEAATERAEHAEAKIKAAQAALEG